MRKFSTLLLATITIASSCLGSDPTWKLGTSDDSFGQVSLTKSEAVNSEIRGYALAFRGPGSRARIDNMPDFTGTGEATISIFFRSDEFPQDRDDGSLGAACLLSIDYDVLLRVYSNGIVYAGFRNKAGELIGVFSTAKTKLGQWHHVVATFSSKEQLLNIYLDGTPVGKSIGPVGTLGPLRSATLVLGNDPDESGFLGDISDVKIFNSVLDTEDIQQLQGFSPE